MHETVEILIKIIKFGARLEVGARFCLYPLSSTLCFSVESGLSVLIPSMGPHDLNHAYTHQQSDFPRVSGRFFFGVWENYRASRLSNITNRIG